LYAAAAATEREGGWVDRKRFYDIRCIGSIAAAADLQAFVALDDQISRFFTL
jgi:hypothetical protein